MPNIYQGGWESFIQNKQIFQGIEITHTVMFAVMIINLLFCVHMWKWDTRSGFSKLFFNLASISIKTLKYMKK